MRGTSPAMLACRMAVMRPEATPTRPSPAEGYSSPIYVLFTPACLCTALFAIYHAAPGFQSTSESPLE